MRCEKCLDELSADSPDLVQTVLISVSLSEGLLS